MKKRSQIFEEYAGNMKEYLHRVTGDSMEEIGVFVDNLIRSNIKDRKVTNLVTVSPGNTKAMVDDLYHFISMLDDQIVSASGSVYMQHEKQMSVIASMVQEMMAKRKKYKNAMFEAIAKDDKVNANKNKFAQATMKINCNSLPGAFGSPFNCFYDKGNYNTITGFNRSLIAHAYSTVEQCIGANEAIFNEEECINHIIVNLRYKPEDGKIDKVMQQYGLVYVEKNDLLDYYMGIVNQYTLTNLEVVSKILDHMNKQEVTYLYYLGKFPFLFQKNEKVFRDFFDNLFNTDNITRDPNTKEEDLKAIDGDQVVAFQVVAAEKLKGYPDLKALKKENMDLYLWFVDFCKAKTKCMEWLNDLLDVFIFYPTDYQHIGNRHEMYRKAVPISDTDSVITTMVKWMLWYNKGSMFVNQNSYSITAMGIYFMTKCVEHSLYKYSIGYGARGKFAKIMKMKNEFLYVALILYTIKKHYAGIIAIHEGIKLSKYKVDIKGGNLRSSAICKESTDFNRDFIVKSILEVFANGNKISAQALIQQVVAFEKHIYDDIHERNTTFLESTAVKDEKEYKNPLSSDYFYYLAWHEIFADKYGDVRLPSKFPTLKLKDITPLYIESIKDQRIKENFTKFFAKYKKWPSAIILNPMMDKFPQELVALANIRDIIYFNLNPAYLTLERMNIDVGHSDKSLLLSDIYGNLNL